ncbi:MAG: tyrosine-type recombinase/integrase [Butyricicoccus sp.]
MIHYHAVVRKALQYAVKNGLVNENMADRVDRPKKGKYLAAFYSKEELAALFEATKDDSISVVIQLAAYYGLRRSEVLGIRWSAIDDERARCPSTTRSPGMVDGRHQIYTEDKLKTKSSFRTLPLIPAVRALLNSGPGRRSTGGCSRSPTAPNTWTTCVPTRWAGCSAPTTSPTTLSSC